MRLGHKIIHTIARTFLCTRIRIFITLKKERRFFGGNGKEETPVPIPNTEVKLFCADGTAWEAEWESRTPPKNFYITRNHKTNRLGFRVFFAFDPRDQFIPIADSLMETPMVKAVDIQMKETLLIMAKNPVN